jgi:hypothetical protein
MNKNIKLTASPKQKLGLKSTNKRRLHISKLHSLCEEKDNLKGLGFQPRPYPHRRRKQYVCKYSTSC